jgi:hypothetical protein
METDIEMAVAPVGVVADPRQPAVNTGIASAKTGVPI